MNNQEKINHIKTNFPMTVLLKKLNIIPQNFNIKYRFPCPIHQGQNPTTCGINVSNKIHCWKCCRDFDIIDVYKEIREINTFEEVIKRILNFMKTDKLHENGTTQEQQFLIKKINFFSKTKLLINYFYYNIN